MGRRTWALLAAIAAVAAACGSQPAPADDGATAPPAETPRSPADTPADAPAAGEPAAAGSPSLVARATAELPVSARPGGPPVRHLPPTTGFGSPRALLVVGEDGDWLQVALPVRPNGSTGWIPRDGVELREVDERVEIDLARRSLTLFDRDEEVLTTQVAIGSPKAPTPTGAFYVVDKLSTDDPGGAYGPFAFGLSAYSVLTEFAGGNGQVGIHGTNDPASIGGAVSHGCIRVRNEVARVLEQHLHLGTPVLIR